MPDENGKQELEIVSDDTHISFVTSKIGRMLDIQQSSDPDGLLKLHILSQNLRSFVLSLISLHFKVCPPAHTSLSFVFAFSPVTSCAHARTDQACWIRVSEHCPVSLSPCFCLFPLCTCVSCLAHSVAITVTAVLQVPWSSWSWALCLLLCPRPAAASQPSSLSPRARAETVAHCSSSRLP